MTADHIPGGYILLSRKVVDSFEGRPAWQLKLWIWMLVQANHAHPKAGQKLQRGQLLATLGDLQHAARHRVGNRVWQPSISAVSRFIRRRAERKAIATRNAKRGWIITICNYDHYQTAANYERKAEGAPNARRMQGERPDHRQERKNGKKEEDKDNVPSALCGFDDFWAAWPKHKRKRGKATCRDIWKRNQLAGRTAEVQVALKHSRSGWAADGNEYVPLPATWLRARPWEDDPADAAPAKKWDIDAVLGEERPWTAEDQADYEAYMKQGEDS